MRPTGADPLDGAPTADQPGGRNRGAAPISSAAVAVLSALAFAPASARAAVPNLEVEAGVVWASRNDVRIPGAGGTDLSLADELSTPAEPAFRVRLGARFAERHLVSLLYAPLRLGASGVLNEDVSFAGATYGAGSPVYAVYRFDSYRATYRYSFVRSEGLDLAAGFTGKIRDAEISLHGAGTSRKRNTGFVPLVNVHVEWRPRNGRLGLVLDGDALAAPQGRAEDVLLALTFSARQGLSAYAGYRMLEGGADNDEVHTFAWLHYAVVGLRLELQSEDNHGRAN